ncbi:TIGR02452 family protein [Dysgonomonas sp.]
MKNNKDIRINSANQTLQIIENKQYQVQGKAVDLASEITYSISNARLYTSEMLENLLLKIDKDITNENKETSIYVENCTSMQAAEQFISAGKTGCLNFASAKNAGGGFMSGAQAQEECLARASTLYPTLVQFQKDMYDYNRSRNTYLYSDRMIYSPVVSFFKDDENHLLPKPYNMDIVTSPAVNIGAMHQNNKFDEVPLVEKVMMNRIDKILGLFYANGVNNLILGAWGCGVFRNESKDVARYFAHFIRNGGKYSKCFDNIIFAVYDSGKKQENISAFQDVF